VFEALGMIVRLRKGSVVRWVLVQAYHGDLFEKEDYFG
jgi:hypothetical protein